VKLKTVKKGRDMIKNNWRRW